MPTTRGNFTNDGSYEIYTTTVKQKKCEIYLNSILGLNPSSDKSSIKKQYKKMAVLLQPGKNTTMGADEAFKLVSETWSVLSDNTK